MKRVAHSKWATDSIVILQNYTPDKIYVFVHNQDKAAVQSTFAQRNIKDSIHVL